MNWMVSMYRNLIKWTSLEESLYTKYMSKKYKITILFWKVVFQFNHKINFVKVLIFELPSSLIPLSIQHCCKYLWIFYHNHLGVSNCLLTQKIFKESFKIVTIFQQLVYLFLPNPMIQPANPTDPGLVLLIKTLRVPCWGLATTTSPLNGATARNVPNMIKQSHWPISWFKCDQNLREK